MQHDQLIRLLGKAAWMAATKKDSDGKTLLDNLVDKLGYRDQYDSAIESIKNTARTAATCSAREAETLAGRTVEYVASLRSRSATPTIVAGSETGAPALEMRAHLAELDDRLTATILASLSRSGYKFHGVKLDWRNSHIALSDASAGHLLNPIDSPLLGICVSDPQQAEACSQVPSGNVFGIAFDRVLRVTSTDKGCFDFFAIDGTLELDARCVKGFRQGVPARCSIRFDNAWAKHRHQRGSPEQSRNNANDREAMSEATPSPVTSSHGRPKAVLIDAFALIVYDTE